MKLEINIHTIWSETIYAENKMLKNTSANLQGSIVLIALWLTLTPFNVYATNSLMVPSSPPVPTTASPSVQQLNDKIDRLAARLSALRDAKPFGNEYLVYDKMKLNVIGARTTLLVEEISPDELEKMLNDVDQEIASGKLNMEFVERWEANLKRHWKK